MDIVLAVLAIGFIVHVVLISAGLHAERDRLNGIPAPLIVVGVLMTAAAWPALLSWVLYDFMREKRTGENIPRT